MKRTPAKKHATITAKIAQLRRRRHSLAVQIDDELQRPAPCSVALQSLKRQRLRMKDQIAYYSALMRSTDRTSFPAPGM